SVLCGAAPSLPHLPSLLFPAARAHCALPSFPTRRSSDLFTRAEEDTWVRRMLARLAASDRRRSPDGEELTRRAETLARQYLDERSEEHTSELQSRFELVCRLLLAKKKPTRHNRSKHQASG